MYVFMVSDDVIFSEHRSSKFHEKLDVFGCHRMFGDVTCTGSIMAFTSSDRARNNKCEDAAMATIQMITALHNLALLDFLHTHASCAARCKHTHSFYCKTEMQKTKGGRK
jgi:hypothetical protein